MKKHRKSKLFLEELRNTPVVSAVCKQIGISRNTIYQWIKDDPEFKKKYEESMVQGTENVNDLAVSQTINKVKQGDTGMIKYWLSHNDDRFMKKSKNSTVDIDFFNSSQERRVDFLDIGESMLMKKILEGDLNAIIFALRHNSGRYHPMKPESPFLDMTDLSDPAVKNIVTEQLNSLSEKINEINAQFSNEDDDT
jgi:hypothetical protein